ncbi:MAG: hypothetical protein D6738_06060, partial [Acidobacteria bacterium]
LYYYWVRAEDDGGRLSSYSARACVRPSEGPVAPADRNIRIADWGASDHPVELWFSPEPRNAAAGYDQTQIEYRIYRAGDTNGDSTPDSYVDYSPGYTANERVATVRWTGLLWAAGDTDNDAIHHSLDGASSWRSSPVSTTNPPREVEFASRLVGVAVGSGGSIRRTSDGGITWTDVASPVSVDLNDVSWLDDTRLVAAGEAGTMLRSDDAGQTWTSLPAVTAETLRAATAQGDVVVLAGDNGAVVRSTDGGLTFAPIAVTGSTVFSACSANEPTGVTVMLGETDRIWRSTDGGATWNAVPLPGAGDILALDCVTGGTAVAAAADHQIYLSPDGLNWSVSSSTGAADPTDAGLLEGGQAFVSDDAGWIHYHGPDGTWAAPQQFTAGSALRGIAVRPEIAWEDASTAGAASGTTHYYIVTARYAVGSATLDGESGMLADRPAALESPDDADDQILVDSCNNFELTVVTP